MYICYVIGAGAMPESIAPDETDLVIAADGGLQTLKNKGITPGLIIGDFDSLGYTPEGDNVTVLPRMKDDTDTAAALRIGVARGYTCFCIYGGCGGREDHTLANIQLLHHLAREGLDGYLIGGGFIRTVVARKTLQIAPKKEGYLSVFSLTDKAEGVTLQGLQYPLQDAALTSDIPLGVSNAFTGVPVTVSVKEGALLVMWQDV